MMLAMVPVLAASRTIRGQLKAALAVTGNLISIKTGNDDPIGGQALQAMFYPFGISATERLDSKAS
jgi:hypothetical protein